MKVLANLFLILTIYITWLTGATPQFVLYFFWVFNISGFFFLSVGFSEQIMSLARGGGLVIFVSYVLLASYMIDQIEEAKDKKEGKNEKPITATFENSSEPENKP